jgi:hypothetical protein
MLTITNHCDFKFHIYTMMFRKTFSYKSMTGALLGTRKCSPSEVPKLWGVPARGAVGRLGGASSFYEGHLFWTTYGCKIKIYILVGILLGWNMNLALFYNLNFTEVYINLKKKCYSLTDLYVKSVYLNLFWWRGSEVHETCWGGGQAIKVWEPLLYVKAFNACELTLSGASCTAFILRVCNIYLEGRKFPSNKSVQRFGVWR